MRAADGGGIDVRKMGYLSGTMSHSIPAITITQHFHNDLCRRDVGQGCRLSPSHAAALITATSVT